MCVFKTTQTITHRQNSRRESYNGLLSIKHNPSIVSVLCRKIVFQINFKQSVITNESFRSDWVEIKRIQVKFLFDWQQSIATSMPWILSVGVCLVLNTLVKTYNASFPKKALSVYQQKNMKHNFINGYNSKIWTSCLFYSMLTETIFFFTVWILVQGC